ncbi:MAG: hypothetical protein IPF41_05160 [Flavobacteriales bacterium]|nr:hypothetical protein [Flavobacteriales bacterium]
MGATRAVGAGRALVFVFFSVDLGPRAEYVEEQPVEDTVVVLFRRLRLTASSWTAFAEGTVKSGASFGGLLGAEGVSASVIETLLSKAEGTLRCAQARSEHP